MTHPSPRIPSEREHRRNIVSLPLASAAPIGQSAGATHSAIYTGWVRHRRFAPAAHAFRYRLALLYLDLAEIDSLFQDRWLWSSGRRNVAEFRRSDYFGDAGSPLDPCVRDHVERQTGERPLGPIRLLTHLRYFGHCFNPVSFYYCYAMDGTTLDAIVADITNTPWKERHAYVLPIRTAQQRGDILRWQFDKRFHVSPFMPMSCRYDWRFSLPADELRVHMNVAPDSGPHMPVPARQFDATLVLQRQPLNAGTLARVLIRHPLMTAQVVAAIHWQALRLWLRGNPVYDHPGNTPIPHSENVP